MWTPRRVLLLVLGVVLFGAAFALYARFLGSIDGLPELPEELLARRNVSDTFLPLTYSPVEAKLQLAFGPGCVESSPAYNIKLEMRGKGMVIAFNEFATDAEGRVRLTPFSLATFKEREGEFPEINTIHADLAILDFDRPVRSAVEIGDRKIIGCQLESDPNTLTSDPRRGRIIVINNRRTATPDDDLVLETPGPVFYREATQPNVPIEKAIPQIKTAAAVQMVDRRHQPDSTTMSAQGMQVFLQPDAPEAPNTPRKPKPKGQAVSGVRRVLLPSNVVMSLWSDPDDGFMATGAKPKTTAAPIQGSIKPTEPAKPPERSHVLIDTPGQFTYDVLPDGDMARFDRLPPAATPLPNCVRVVRPIIKGPGEAPLNDQLECDTLVLRFAEKNADKTRPAPAGPAKPKVPAAKEENSSSIVWAHAWGQFIVLTSDVEKLVAHGNDLVYDARTKGTTLKGVPEMVAVKEGHEIHAPEMVMYSAEAQQGRHAEAKGAGYFKLVSQDGPKRTVEARWRDQMIYRQEEGNDLIILNGDGVFEDRENKQMLRADLLKLWLAPEPKPPAEAADKSKAGDKPKAPDDDTTPKFHPRRLEATGHVDLRSPDLNDHDTEQLELRFTDAPPAPKPAPATGTGNSPWTNPVNPAPPPAGAPAKAGPTATSPAAGAPVAGQPAAAPPATTPPPKKPIDLTARIVQADVIRRGDVNELDSVHCEDNVHVHQDPVPPQERPIDMRGRTLQLKHTPDGDILQVHGTVNAPGEVHLPDISLIGPNVVIDQVENVAEVQGLGSMRMISNTDFDGKKLAKPTPLIVTWKQGMRFTGKQAVFRGNVQADQETTTVLCQIMQVDLNKPVSLKQQATNSRTTDPHAAPADPASVDKVVCDAGPDSPQGVIITDIVRENGQLMSSRRIAADEVIVHKDEGLMDAANHPKGRGTIRIVQLGPKDEQAGMSSKPPDRKPANGRPGAKPPQPVQPAQPVEQEYKATLIRYYGTMHANNQTRTAHFREGVELLHMPVETPEQQISFDATVNKLPLNTLYLRSQQMDVRSTKDANGQTRQEMIATGKADVTWGVEFFGASDVIKFDESKQQLTLEGLDGHVARARRLAPGGGDRGEIIARKIIYNRVDDTVFVEGAYSATGR